MHRRLIARTRGDERGAIAIIVAASMTLLCVVSAMVLDFGLARVDRQIDSSGADAATLAGLHGLLSRGDGNPHPYAGVCTAVRYLKANSPRFDGITENSGWTDGLNAATGNGCSSVALRNKVCSKTNKATWAKWAWSGVYQGVTLNITVESGFSFVGATRPEDGLAASSPDTTEQGCDTLAITVAQSRKPGMGSIVSTADLTTSIRSVGRVRTVPGKSAPAMLLLKRTGCPTLRAGNSGSGSGTFIHVLGAITTSGYSMPGTIHADSDGLGCTGGSNSNIFVGAQNDGIVAFAAPLASNPLAPDPLKPGLITSVAKQDGLSGSVIRDGLDYVYGSSALSTGGAKNEVVGRSLITRKLVDERYFTGVKAAISASASIFAAPSAPTGFNQTLNNCSPTQAQINSLSLTATDKLYVNCTANNGFNGASTGLVINAGAVYFKGVVNPSGTLSLPNATKVYIANSIGKANALAIGNNTSFEMNNAAANLSGSLCSSAVSTTLTKATLFVQSGSVAQSSGTLRLCRTTAFMLGGRSDGCVPTTPGTAPSTMPCAGAVGTGQWTQTGGDIDWTAPNTLDTTLDTTTKLPIAAAVAAWDDASGPEDLALWSESATTTSETYNMNGGGVFNVRGVFMVPNADPFKLSGGAGMNLTNAQYICSSIELNGGTQITMKVDPNSAVVLPELDLVGLIR